MEDSVEARLLLSILVRLMLDSNIPISVLRDVISAGEDASRTMKEVRALEAEALRMIKEIESLRKELRILRQERAFASSKKLLEDVVGTAAMEQYSTRGFVELPGRKNALYRVFADGSVEKHILKSSLFRQKWEIEWRGRINADRYPYPDAVATVCAHIIRDSDRFDIEKRCGEIIVESESE